ncbi:unnamed protein product [Gordionus sp. m RMFG-2023]
MNLNVCIYALLSSSLVGLAGLFPLFIFYSGFQKLQLKLEEPHIISRLLGFAAGCLLGDIFFHLFPEAWIDFYQTPVPYQDPHYQYAFYFLNTPEFWVLLGLLSFFIFEKLFDALGHCLENYQKILSYHRDSKIEAQKSNYLFAPSLLNWVTEIVRSIKHVFSDESIDAHLYEHIFFSNSNAPDDHQTMKGNSKSFKKYHEDNKFDQRTGYLNLFANFIDNFTHGLAIAASYSSKIKMGVLTTCAIFLHEIPHEFGDFAILLKSGFNTWSAIKAQMITSIGCILGAFCGILPSLLPSLLITSSTYRILAFTSGGFIHIVMVKILPDLLKQSINIRENFIQIAGFISGLFLMYVVANIE